jgi:acyl carrier protein
MELLRRVADTPDETLEAITSAEHSPSATYLKRLAAAEAGPETAGSAQEAARAGQKQALLLPEQARLAQIWASALGIDVNEISANESFFDLGGDSLLAMRVIQQAEQVMGFRVEPRRYVFETLGQLAVAAAGTAIDLQEQQPAVADGSGKRGLLGRMFSGWGRKA